MSAQSVAGRGRPGALVGLGILLLLACFFPVTDGDDVEVLTISALDDSGVDDIVRVGLVYLGAAGLAIILVTALVPRPVRGIVVLAIGVVGYVILLILAEKLQMNMALAFVFGTFGAREVIGYVLMLLGTACLVGGSRARWHAPWSLKSAIIAAVGGLVLMGSFVFPGLPRDTMPVEMAVEGLDKENSLFLAICMLLWMALLATASILALCNWKKSGRGPAKLGNASFWLSICAWLVIYAGTTIATIDGTPDRGNAIIAVISLAMSICLASFCVIFTAPLGLSDLLVTTSGEGRVVDSGSATSEGIEYRRRPAEKAVPIATVEPTQDVTGRLQKLKELYKDGLITEEEFELKRQRLVDEL